MSDFLEGQWVRIKNGALEGLVGQIMNHKPNGPGVHINAVGSYTPQKREVPAETVRRALVVVDSRHAAWEEAGDLIQARDAGAIDERHIHSELGELVLGRKSGRTNDQQVTFFKSVGLAVQDAVAARVALGNATRLQIGQTVVW